MKIITQRGERIERSLLNIIFYLTLVMFAQTILYYLSNALGSEILQRFLLAFTIIFSNLLFVILGVFAINVVKKIKNK
ncbi:MAG: hypothetical protein ACK40E_04965 [Caldimicrobium sp.]